MFCCMCIIINIDYRCLQIMKYKIIIVLSFILLLVFCISIQLDQGENQIIEEERKFDPFRDKLQVGITRISDGKVIQKAGIVRKDNEENNK